LPGNEKINKSLKTIPNILINKNNPAWDSFKDNFSMLADITFGSKTNKI